MGHEPNLVEYSVATCQHLLAREVLAQAIIRADVLYIGIVFV
jgi:hypothetical protein